jgi:protein-S-isoprenylcysteine O-methyltransferase Ste14
MALTAAVLYLTGIFLAFGWRSLAHRRATGDTGLRLDAGPPGSVGWWTKLTFITALVLGLAGPVAALAGMAPIGMLDRRWLHLSGLVVALAGVVATLVAQAAMGTSWRVGVDPGEHTELVTTGVFALSRNPVFAAMLATSVGLALMVPNPVSLVATAALFVSIEAQVRAVEEPHLADVHGDVYTAYRLRVGRFVPRWRRGPVRLHVTGPDRPRGR